MLTSDDGTSAAGQGGPDLTTHSGRGAGQVVMTVRVSLGLGLVAGIGLVAVARRIARGTPGRFYAVGGARRPPPDGSPGPDDLELTYHRTEQVVSVHAVDYERALAVLPRSSLYPVRLPDGRALLGVSGARYLEGTAPGPRQQGARTFTESDS